MKSRWKKALGICAFLGLVLSIIFGWHYITAGFRLSKVQSSLETDTSNSNVDEKISSILSQQFTYLGKGRQSFVFSSADHQYVLKLFRYHLVQPHFTDRLYAGFFPNSLKESWKKCLHTRSGWEKSYQLASKFLQKETAIVYLHLYETSCFKKKIKLKDALGRKFTVDADTAGFLLQKKTDLFYDKVQSCLKNKKINDFEHLISSYLQTVINRSSKHIQNKDHSWLKNYGVTKEGEVIEIDVGRFAKKYLWTTPQEKKDYLLAYTHPLQLYLQKKAPVFHQKLLEMIEQQEKEG